MHNLSRKNPANLTPSVASSDTSLEEGGEKDRNYAIAPKRSSHPQNHLYFMIQKVDRVSIRFCWLLSKPYHRST
jgi:hypothetical protein